MSLNKQIEGLCSEAVRLHTFPGCVVGYIRNGASQILPFGKLTYDEDSPVVTTETVYDVASITKSIPTSSVILKLIEDGKLSLDDQVIKYIPELENKYRKKILVRHLLTYTTAFDPGSPLSEIAKASPDGIMPAIFSAPLRASPGLSYWYLDAPAILLGLLVERIRGQPLQKTAQEMFFEPLKMTHTTFDAQSLDISQIAASEMDWRGELKGIPQDEKAWALGKQGKALGHAGLFSTAGDLLIFAEMLLNNGEYHGKTYFSRESTMLMHTNQNARVGEAESFGWQMDRVRWMGDHISSQAFGRTGFPGASILIDPKKKIALVHVSNHTYPKRPSQRAIAINTFRRKLADLVFID